jgi:hypothetical protein
MHAALLAIIVFGFTGAPQFGDTPESIPVETVTQNQFNQIMKGERDAKAEAPAPATAPEPAAAPTPPQPPPELRRDEEAQTPPPPPAAPPSPPPKAETPPPKAPEPPPRPAPPPSPSASEQAPPEPPERPKALDSPPDPPKQLVEERPKPEPPQKPPEPRKQPAKFDPNAIAKLIGQSKPAPSSAAASPPRGLPNQNAPHMSPSLAAALDAWFKDTYLGCWQLPPTQPDGETYIAEVRVAFNADGSLAARPVLLNPPTDPAWRAHADSAMRAVMKCNPLRVPTQYMPYFESWKTETIHFDPQSVQG